MRNVRIQGCIVLVCLVTMPRHDMAEIKEIK